MKRLLFLYLLLYISMLFAQIQQTIELSKEKVIINGKKYYLHTVQAGQTLYSISKAYNSTVAEVLEHNPNLTPEIKPNQVIKIPVKPEVRKNISDEKQNIIIHKVEPSQTLYAISRYYGVKIDEILSVNKLSSDSIKIGQQLLIPITQQLDKSSTVDTQFIEHLVIEKETLYGLSKFYNTSIEKIIQYNPESAYGLKVGMKLKIPHINNTKKLPNVLQVKCDSIPKQNIVGKKVNIALLLPFSISNTVSFVQDHDIDNDERLLEKKEDVFSQLVLNFIEFYNGLLLAFNDLKEEGITINCHVFDTERNITNLEKIYNQPGFQNSEIIIGPVFNEQIVWLNDKLKLSNKIWVLPFYQGDTLNNPNLFQINSIPIKEVETIAEFLQHDSINNIFFIYNGKETKWNEKIRKIIQNKSYKNKKLQELYIYNNDFKQLLTQLDTSKENYIVSFTSDEIFVSSLLGQLETRLLYYPIHTIGMSEWRFFKNIDFSYLHNQKFTCFANFYTSYNSPNTKKFFRQYRLLFGTDPAKYSKLGYNYAMIGYDIGRYFIYNYSAYKENFIDYARCIPYNGIQNNLLFNFHNSSLGYFNNFFYIIEYSKDLTIRIKTQK